MFPNPIRRRRSTALALVVLLILAVPAPTAAFSVNVSAVVRFWSCDHNWSWRGAVNHLLGAQSAGTFDYCFSLLQIGTADSAGRIQDGDSRYDTYIVSQDIDWHTASNGGGSDNSAKVTMNSSIAAIGGGYDAAPSLLTSSTCAPIYASAGIAGIGVSVGPILCDNATLRRDKLDSQNVQWSTSDVSRTPRLDLAYIFKVNQGAKPKITALLSYPYYTMFKDGGSYCGGGYCVPTYGYTAHWYTDPWIVTAP